MRPADGDRRVCPEPRPDEGVVLKREARTLVWSRRAGDGVAEVVKMYLHRGAWAAVRGSLLPCRVAREHRALTHLLDNGIPCCEPRSWRRGVSRRLGYFELLVTREIPGARSLAELLCPLAPERCRVDLDDLFVMVRRMHEAGLFHGTLYPGNVLTAPDGGGVRFYITDAPRSVLFPASIVGTGMARYDLQSLCQWLLTRVTHGDPLRAYGLTAAAARTLRRQCPAFHPCKAHRQGLRGTFLARAAVARAVGCVALARGGPVGAARTRAELP